MHENEALRTAEAWLERHAETDHKLATMVPRYEPTAAEWAEGFRAFAFFLVGIGGGVLACLAIG